MKALPVGFRALFPGISIHISRSVYDDKSYGSAVWSSAQPPALLIKPVMFAHAFGLVCDPSLDRQMIESHLAAGGYSVHLGGAGSTNPPIVPNQNLFTSYRRNKRSSWLNDRAKGLCSKGRNERRLHTPKAHNIVNNNELTKAKAKLKPRRDTELRVWQ